MKQLYKFETQCVGHRGLVKFAAAIPFQIQIAPQEQIAHVWNVVQSFHVCE